MQPLRSGATSASAAHSSYGLQFGQIANELEFHFKWRAKSAQMSGDGDVLDAVQDQVQDARLPKLGRRRDNEDKETRRFVDDT